MDRPHLEVAEIIRQHGEDFFAAHGASATSAHRRILRALVNCRTAALGGHLDECDSCGYRHPSYNSCRNRHCPKCHESATADWFDDHREDLLPVPYFHLVFTLPAELRAIALQNKRLVYGNLFQAASSTLLTVAADPKHLGAQIGFLAVLHTWGQLLELHPHVHCIVPAGGLSPDGSRWIAARGEYFLPVKVLSRLFRGRFLALIQRARESGKLELHGSVAGLRDPTAWRRLIDKLYRKEWVVYAKPPFGGAESVLKYLARYAHRIAISNDRLIALDHGRVTFSWKDYADEHRRRTTTLEAAEFIRRFLLHELPRGFVRVRHYGFLANASRAESLPLCRRLIPQPEVVPPAVPHESTTATADKEAPRPCPICKRGILRFVHDLAAMPPHEQRQLPGLDSS